MQYVQQSALEDHILHRLSALEDLILHRLSALEDFILHRLSALEDLILHRLSLYKTDFKCSHVLLQTLSFDAFKSR